jgi:3-methyladenine DNA glycosylase/8-oxoguanine DNA glycosylase
MGDHPIPLAMHDGWVYAVILEGRPTLNFDSSTRVTRPGEVFIFHPDCAYGWEDKPKKFCRLMTWLWHTPPTHSKLVPTPGNFQHIRASAKMLRQILIIHQHSVRGGLPSLADCDKMTDAEIIQKLTELNGVGRWTVEMFLIFNLARPDVVPVHDLGVRRGFQIAYKRKMPEPEQLEKFGQRWKPYRTLAARYLWRAVDGE